MSPAKNQMKLPKIEVQFDDLTIEAEIGSGERDLPTLINYTLNFAEELLRIFERKKRRRVKILDGVKGTLKPSRMTLIIGPPGSGKSTFLKALSGKLNLSLKMTGKVTYNGRNITNFIPQRTYSYVSQYDLHHAEMTVRETLDFARLMLGAAESAESLKEVFRREKLQREEESESSCSSCFTEEGSVVNEDEIEDGYVTDYILKMLGLEECADVIIGDAMRRGISGGQKKRVTIGEMLVGLSRCYFMDDISTGLDSSTTFKIVKFLRNTTHILDLTTAISLLQPLQETYELFDDIILLCEGKIVCQGPRENVLQFFKSMGFMCPKRKNPADFLQEVTSRNDQEQYWIGGPSRYEYITVEKFEESYKSYLDQFHMNDLCPQYDQTGKDISIISKDGNYKISQLKVFKACFSRELLLTKRNMLVLIFKNVQISILAIVIMTIFFHTQMHHNTIAEGYKFMGAIFAAVVVVKFNGMSEMAMMMKRLPVFYKQREQLFLPSWALSCSTFLISLPMSMVEAGLWTCLSYYSIGFAPSSTRFLLQFLALFCVHQMSMGIFRFIATIGRTQVMANTFGIVTLIFIYILGGFMLSKDDAQPWLVWGNWISPLTYGQNAVAINEFLDDRWNTNEIQYENVTYTYGAIILKTKGMFTEAYWYWICIGVLIGYSVVFNTFSFLALAYLNAPHKREAHICYQAEDCAKTTKIQNLIRVGNCNETLPFQPVTFVFSHINYYVDTPSEVKKHGFTEKKLQLLRDISGVFKPGVLTALIGVTGAGKTTLLDVLAGRKTGGYIEGSINISGYQNKQEIFSRVAAYCEQTDGHSPFVTVKESLQFSARLRLPSNIEAKRRNMFVNEVMDLVELRPLENAIVGVPGVHGLSAGQRKRLTIAVELVSSPSLIFLDEPTSGLDARAAAIVMRTLRKTVDTGRTIVCTIHQPSIEIFEAFDELLLMKRGGQLIYGGSLGPLSKTMIQYFEAINGIPKFQHTQSPAAWMLEVTSDAMEMRHDIDFVEIYHRSLMFLKNNALVDELSKTQSNSGDLHFPSKYVRSFKDQCIACIWKQNKSYWKNPEHNVIRFIITILISLLFGAVFWRLGGEIKTEQNVLDILGVMYGSALFLGFTNTMMVQPIVEMERTVFYRERSSGMYSSLPYAIAQVAVEIPYIIIQALIFSFTVYSMVGFQFTMAKFIWFLFFIFISLLYMTYYGMLMISLSPSQEIAALLSFLVFVMWSTFSGFFVPRTLIPTWWGWFYWIDPCAWTVYGLMITQLGDDMNLISMPGRPDTTVKQYLKAQLGFQDDLLYLTVTLEILLIIFLVFGYGFCIKHLNFQRR